MEYLSLVLFTLCVLVYVMVTGCVTTHIPTTCYKIAQNLSSGSAAHETENLSQWNL